MAARRNNARKKARRRRHAAKNMALTEQARGGAGKEAPAPRAKRAK